MFERMTVQFAVEFVSSLERNTQCGALSFDLEIRFRDSGFLAMIILRLHICKIYVQCTYDLNTI